jgi:hypothetical protein
VLRVERSFLRKVLAFWEQLTQELQQGRNKASRWNSERERLRALIMQVLPLRYACVNLARFSQLRECVCRKRLMRETQTSTHTP